VEVVDPTGLDLSISELLSLDGDEIRSRFRRTPLRRPRQVGVLRDVDAIPQLERVHASESGPRVRELMGGDLAVLME
jgi:hypothetical protein